MQIKDNYQQNVSRDQDRVSTDAIKSTNKCAGRYKPTDNWIQNY
jgi:hypothetical protein